MPARIRFEVDGKAEFDRTFSRLDENFSDLTDIWDDVRDAFWEIEKDQFYTQGKAGASGAWKELSPAYEAQKINKYGTLALLSGILRATGALYESLTRQTEHTVYEKSKDEMVIGSNLERGKFHQRGGGRLPQRKVIDFSDKQKKELQKTIQRSLARKIRRQGTYIDDGSGESIG